MFSYTISPRDKLLDLRLKEVWQYRDLLMIFVYRDFVTVYKQTILGPLWFFIQPFLTTIVFTVIFGSIAKIPTDGLPPMLFYLAGVTSWNYFSGCFQKTSNTFVNNAGIFGKVFFPRVITPLSVVISNLILFSIQFLLFLLVMFYFMLKGANVHLADRPDGHHGTRIRDAGFCHDNQIQGPPIPDPVRNSAPHVRNPGHLSHILHSSQIPLDPYRQPDDLGH
jgi:hypothetical protein